MASVAFSPFKFGKQLVSNPDPFKDFFIHPLLSVVPHANLLQWSNLINNRNNQLYEMRVSSIDINKVKVFWEFNQFEFFQEKVFV